MIHVAIVDDKRMNRAGIKDKLSLSIDFKVVLEADNGDDFLEKMKKLKILPDVVIMDIEMPVKDGIETIQIATGLYPEVKFLIHTVFDEDNKIFEAIKAGAVGYLLKDETPEKIIQSLREVIEYGGSPMSPKIARKALQLLANAKVEENEKIKSPLSDRELQILKLMVDGKDYKEIGEVLYISPFTVRAHTTHIYKKLHVSNKAQAVKIAIKNKWFSL